jgi:hypothetical protein
MKRNKGAVLKRKFRLWCVLHPYQRSQKDFCNHCLFLEKDECPDITWTIRRKGKVKRVSWQRQPVDDKGNYMGWLCVEFLVNGRTTGV